MIRLRQLLPLSISLALACAWLPGRATAQGDKVNFEKQVWPILKSKCVKCHGAPHEEDGRMKKPKADLRLDAAWGILAGGEDGKVLHPGDASNSEMWWRTDLAPDDDDFMPAKGDPLTSDEKALLKKWIDQGADFGAWEGNLEGRPKDATAEPDKIGVAEIQALYKKLGDGLKPLGEDAWKSVTAAGGRVQPLGPGSPLLAVDFRMAGGKADDAAVGTVDSIGANVAHLDLSGTSVTDAALAGIGGMPRLVRLDLHQTGIGDAGVARLTKLENLRYLNLYGTGVTDAGLKPLESMKTLDHLYLWQSKVTEPGAKQLQKALPDARINWK